MRHGPNQKEKMDSERGTPLKAFNGYLWEKKRLQPIGEGKRKKSAKMCSSIQPFSDNMTGLRVINDKVINIETRKFPLGSIYSKSL